MRRNGKYGSFYGCSNYPKCKFIKQQQNKLEGVACPKCGGAILVRQGRNRTQFYSCEKYPECDWSSWDLPVAEKCPECGEVLLDVKGKKGRMYVCSNTECRYRRTLELDTKARCPNCHKFMTLKGEGDKKQFFCSCGYREKHADFSARKKSEGASNFEVKKFMQEQKKEESKGFNNALAEQLAAWSKGKK